MKKIPLGRFKFAIVDNKDYEWLSKFKWYCDSKGYAVRSVHRYHMNNIAFKMHREILDAPSDKWVDHRNGNRIDNRRCNIRLATPSQNAHHTPPNSKNTTGYKGVSYRKITNRWRVCICCNGKKFEFGEFNSPEDAARAYNAAARKLFGKFSFQNKIR